ncbi:MAG TPA: 50S ribosomal protein L30e [Methylomirabilota bacterium]|nr:50S ribosomal protein L30e [Methylomirabilota bacterium]
MQSTKIDVNKQIQIASRTGKIALGAKEALESAKLAKAKLLILASNCPESDRTNIMHYAKQSAIPVHIYAGTSIDLGSACGKKFVVSALTIKEPGDSEIMKLAVN